MEPSTSAPSAMLPFQLTPHDSLRQGLPSLKEEYTATKHPVEAIQEQHAQRATSSSRLQTLKDLYGVAAPAKLQIETQILGKFGRLPGLPSSQLGLESLTGALDEFEFESFVGVAADEAELLPPDLHSRMEAKLKMGTKPVARGMF